MISRPVRVRVVLCGLAASPKGRRGADQAARAAASGKAGPPQPADPTRPAPRRQAPGLALRQDQDRSVPPCLKRSRAALPGAGRARPAPLRAGASRRAPPGRAPEPRPAPCEGDGQRRIHLSRKLAPAPQATAVLHRRRRTSPGQRCRSPSRRLASAPLGSGTARSLEQNRNNVKEKMSTREHDATRDAQWAVP